MITKKRFGKITLKSWEKKTEKLNNYDKKVIAEKLIKEMQTTQQLSLKVISKVLSSAYNIVREQLKENNNDI